MADIASKRQIKPGVRVAMVNLPEGVDLGAAKPSDAPSPDDADVVIVFATDRTTLESHAAPAIDAARRDSLTWIAYPKAGQLSTDLTRDSLNEAMNAHGIQAVRQVAIDDVWSALRFRPLRDT